MNKVIIKDFGPIHEALVDLEKNFQVFIGAQASGKSTICKVVYFCQKIRDYTLDFMMDSEQFSENHKNEYFNNYLKYLTRQFMGCFGKTTHMQDFYIEHRFGQGNRILIRLNKDGYVRFFFSKNMRDAIDHLILDAAGMHLNSPNISELRTIMDGLTIMAEMKKMLRRNLCNIFENTAEILYIPAGRSLLATMSEQLQDFSIADMDLTMQEFINLIRNTKARFGNKIPEMVKDYTKTVKGQINNSTLDQAYKLIRNILKADYTSDSEGEKIYFDEWHWVKLMYGSSGQQEALWILMLCFIAMLEKKKSFMIIEEPEAHLFPIAQKDMISLIALMVNTTDSSVIITTHSPYILTSLNILLYSNKVENCSKSSDTHVIHKNMRLSYDLFEAFKIVNASEIGESMESLMDEESHMIRVDYIDEVSNITNDELELLLEKESLE